MSQNNNQSSSDWTPGQRRSTAILRSRIVSHLSVSILGGLFVFAAMQFEMDAFKGILVDGLFRIPSLGKPNREIVVISYDDSSSERFGNSARFPVSELKTVFELLQKSKPLVIGVVGSFNERVYSSFELKELNSIFGTISNTVIGFNDDESLGQSRPAQFTLPFSYYPGFVSRDTFSYGGDSVSRRIMLTIEGQPTFFWAITQSHCLFYQRNCIFNDFQKDTVGNSTQAYVHWRPGRHLTFSSRAVTRNEVSPEAFTNKIVIVGTELTARKGADHILTPYSRSTYETPMLEGVAQSIASLIENRAISRSPVWAQWVISIAVGLLTVNFVLAVSPGRGILFVISECLAMILVGWISLRFQNVWVDLAHPLVIACMSYYLVIPYRLVDEYRKRWHYQEKSELMAELEQLKSNFLSLVSHDLKTPIARIQGNAELVLRSSAGLSENNKSPISAIVKTTEELSEYVESILDLTRVESARVPLNKSSRDINSTIIEVTEEKRLQAQEKNIELKTQLDPIFSIRYDVKLIKRVFGNLIENAIKYSPNGSVITLESKEENDWIRVSIKDQGIGIKSEDQERVFYKFFRCDNQDTQKIKGTGLGLYLVKYFVELHRGFISLESEWVKGSTFTVTLPVAL